MNDKTEFSYTFDISQAAIVPKTEQADWLAFDVCKAYQFSDTNLLVRNPRNGKRSVVSQQVFSALTMCDKFHTLDEHTEQLLKINSAPPSQAGEVRKVLTGTIFETTGTMC